MLAKNAEMAALLSKAFSNKRVVKYYVGLSAKKSKKKNKVGSPATWYEDDANLGI